MSAAIPNLERMYECGDVLANAKGLSYKAVSILCPPAETPASCSDAAGPQSDQGPIWALRSCCTNTKYPREGTSQGP